ncbi:MAG: hypothetical protein ACRECH_00765 [Nitrososphaerales archaeon]
MSTIIAIKNDNSYEVIDRQLSPASESSSWSLVGKALGYPDSWVAIIKERLAKDGKSWRWRMTKSSSTLLEPTSEENAPALREGGQTLLIINGQTPTKAIRDALLLVEKSNAEITVVYISRPPLMLDSLTEGEVDQKFTLELEKGRAILSKVASEATNLGVKNEGSFVWAESSSDLLKQHGFHADLVIDEAA